MCTGCQQNMNSDCGCGKIVYADIISQERLPLTDNDLGNKTRGFSNVAGDVKEPSFFDKLLGYLPPLSEAAGNVISSTKIDPNLKLKADQAEKDAKAKEDKNAKTAMLVVAAILGAGLVTLIVWKIGKL